MAYRLNDYWNKDLEKWVFKVDGHIVEVQAEKEIRTDSRTAVFVTIDGSGYEFGFNYRFGGKWYYGLKGYGYKTAECFEDILYTFKIYPLHNVLAEIILMSPNAEILRPYANVKHTGKYGCRIE